MATYTINRKDFKNGLTARELQERIKAFHLLYCDKSDNGGVRTYIQGEWWTDTNRPIKLDGSSDAKIAYFGVAGLSVTIEYRDEMLEKQRIIVELTPDDDVGFTEIMLITVNGV